MSTLYRCPKCNTREHYATDVCPADELGSSTVKRLPVEQELVGSTPIQPAIKKAQEFIRKIGRPKIYADAKVRRRQYMKEYRARKR